MNQFAKSQDHPIPDSPRPSRVVGASRHPFLGLVLWMCTLALLGGACASPYQQHAGTFAHQTLNDKNGRVGTVTEHVLNLKDNSFYLLQDSIKNARGELLGDMNVIGFQGFLINGLHASKCKELARIWEPGSEMRADLRLRYGEAALVEYNRQKLAFYYWHSEPSNLPFSSSNVVQSWIYIGPELFGKSDIREVTLEEVQTFFKRIDSNPIVKVRLKYLGTGAVPCPPCWGNINYFDLVSIEPTAPLQ